MSCHLVLSLWIVKWWHSRDRKKYAQDFFLLRVGKSASMFALFCAHQKTNKNSIRRTAVSGKARNLLLWTEYGKHCSFEIVLCSFLEYFFQTISYKQRQHVQLYFYSYDIGSPIVLCIWMHDASKYLQIKDKIFFIFVFPARYKINERSSQALRYRKYHSSNLRQRVPNYLFQWKFRYFTQILLRKTQMKSFRWIYLSAIQTFYLVLMTKPMI